MLVTSKPKNALNMNPKTAPNSELKYLIKNTQVPLLIKDVLNWELVKWDLTKWKEILGKEQLLFRRGKNMYTEQPQFENTTSTICMTFQQFLEYQEGNPHEWLYFDYKYLKQWLVNIPEFQSHISWKEFGFPKINFEESTIWIGSKGAHTPCHVDTYSCNIIAQVYGRKRWILFPPNENLQPTRIPYEESSIYSKINLFTPCLDDFKNIGNCKTVVLNPGDVLILPHRWWHYVENVDLAISINTWIQLPVDDEERFGESIARLLISQMTKNLNPEQQQLFINPSNDLDDQSSVLEESVTEAISSVQMCLQYYKSKSKILPTFNQSRIEEILQKFKNIRVIESLPAEGLKMLLEIQKNKFEYKDLKYVDIEQEDERKIKKIIDSLLHQDVINVIKQKLLED